VKKERLEYCLILGCKQYVTRIYSFVKKKPHGMQKESQPQYKKKNTPKRQQRQVHLMSENQVVFVHDMVGGALRRVVEVVHNY
jgi:hypothetical protein